VPDRRQRHQRPGGLLLQHAVRSLACPAPPVFLGNRHPEPPSAPSLEDVTWHPPPLLPLRVGGYHPSRRIAVELAGTPRGLREEISTMIPLSATSFYDCGVCGGAAALAHVPFNPVPNPVVAQWIASGSSDRTRPPDRVPPARSLRLNVFSRSGSAPFRRALPAGTGAKASFTSNAARCLHRDTGLAQHFLGGGMGPVIITTGFLPVTAPSRLSHLAGSKPMLDAILMSVTTTPCPIEICEEFLPVGSLLRRRCGFDPRPASRRWFPARDALIAATRAVVLP